MIIGYKRNLHWFFSSFHLNHKYFKIRLKVYFIWSELLIFIYHAPEWYNLRMSTGFMMSSWNVMYFILRVGYSLTGAWGTTLDSLLEPNTPRSVTPRTRHPPHRQLYSTELQVIYGLQLQHHVPFRLISGKCCWIFFPFVRWTQIPLLRVTEALGW